jgi:two-component system response regulator NreC
MDKSFFVLIVDDDRASTHCLYTRLCKTRNVKHVDCANSAEELFSKFLPVRSYQIIYLDQRMPEMDGTEAIKFIREKYPDIKIIFHTSTHDLTEADKIFKTNPDGWLWKDFKCSDAEISAETVMRGVRFYSKEVDEIFHSLYITSQMLNADDGETAELSKREKEVLYYHCKGISEKETGKILFIDTRTVEGHMRNVHKKTKKKTRAELMTYAMDKGLIPRF